MLTRIQEYHFFSTSFAIHIFLPDLKQAQFDPERLFVAAGK